MIKDKKAKKATKKVVSVKPAKAAAKKTVKKAAVAMKAAKKAAPAPKLKRATVPHVLPARVNPAQPAIQPKAEVKAPLLSKPVERPHPERPHAEKAHAAPKPQPVKPKEEIRAAIEAKPEPKEAGFKEIELKLPITVKDLSIKLQEKPSAVIKILMDMRIMVGINQPLDEALVNKICEKFRFKVIKALGEEELALSAHTVKDEEKDLSPRSPVVTFMGHVDHGKTSLLDAIRKTKVAEGEHGGITQHIGAYRVALPNGAITFLDTPGHEAFTAMRSRGAKITDIVVLVVAADDGIMPQTQEAVDHARAAGVSIIAAVNKIDKAGADIDRVKKQLAKIDLNPEDWGGKTIVVPVSAKTGEGIDNLLEMIILESQMLELKANPNRLAKGVVIEAQMSKGRGPVATLLIQNGTLHLNENIIVGNFFGKIRAMFNDHGQSVTAAVPSVPVEVLGISGIPAAGEQFFAIAQEKEAKELASLRMEKDKANQVKTVKRVSLEDLHTQIQEGKIKELKLVLKADVQGSLEAIKDTLSKLNVSEIKLDFIHCAVGNINSSDIILAIASNALVLGFNVAADELAKELTAKEGVDVKTYNIIYELANDIKAAIEGMLEPKIKKVFLGRAEVRKMFKLSRAGTVAGCFVTKGKFNRNCLVTLVRNGQPVFEGKLSSLKRFKDDVREVAEGFECGMSLTGFDQVMEGDVMEAYTEERIIRRI
jgi:translation initiation factor IF-2